MVELHVQVDCDWIRQFDVCHRLLGLLLHRLLLIRIKFLATCRVDGSLVAGGSVYGCLKNVEVFAMMRADILHV